MIEKIVSGGQTGVDQAALTMAWDAGIKVGGYCPKGGLDENGMDIRTLFPTFKEASTSIPDERTRLNIDNSDATLIIVPYLPMPATIVDGTKLTIDYSKQQEKPHLVVGLSDKHGAIDQILSWINQHEIRVLNIGGPRESSWPGIYKETCELLSEVFLLLRPRVALSKL